jgi:predicted nucleic acid-binding protein
VKVVDASVVLQWLLQETSTGSRDILEAHLDGSEPLVAPELLNYEVANVLATKTKLTADEASELFGIFLDLRIETYSLGTDEYKASLELASRLRVTVYDASYVALASALHVTLATADKKLATRTAQLKIVDMI